MNASAVSPAKLSLLPLLLFVLLFLGTGLYLQSQGVAYAFIVHQDLLLLSRH